jgi:hypothetical protein
MVRSDAAVSSDHMPVACAFLHAIVDMLNAMIRLANIPDHVLPSR